MFLVRLTGVEGGALLRANSSSLQLRIRRNDSPLRFSHSVMAVPESAGVIALNVTRGRLTEDGPLVGSVATEVAFYSDFQSIRLFRFRGQRFGNLLVCVSCRSQ